MLNTIGIYCYINWAYFMVHARVQDYESRCSYCRLINRLINLNSIVFWRSFMIYAILYDHHGITAIFWLTAIKIQFYRILDAVHQLLRLFPHLPHRQGNFNENTAEFTEKLKRVEARRIATTLIIFQQKFIEASTLFYASHRVEISHYHSLIVKTNK